MRFCFICTTNPCNAVNRHFDLSPDSGLPHHARESAIRKAIDAELKAQPHASVYDLKKRP
jgi:hypothetical protein